MEYCTVKKLLGSTADFGGKQIAAEGWIRTLRVSKNCSFIELNDGSCLKNLQIVVGTDVPGYAEIIKFTVGSCVLVRGTVVLTPQAKQPLELSASEVVLNGACDTDYPIQKKGHTVEFLRTVPHLRPRTNLFHAVFRIRSALTHAIYRFLEENEFVYMPSPCITSSDCEGAGEVFQITTLDGNDLPKGEDGNVDYSKDFFGKKTYMTVSGQLNLEPFCMAFRNVYTFGPCFRAENSNTTRHVAEFWQVEPEMAFVDLDGLMDMIEKMTKFLVRYVLEHAAEEIEFCGRFVEKGLIDKLKNVAESEFARITYSEAFDLLEKSGKTFTVLVKRGGPVQTEYERYLAEEVFARPVFITDYPKEIKSFYMKLNADGKTVAATDLLFPGLGEIVGASQREENYDVLLARIGELGLDPDEYRWYLDTRRFGTCVHSGFGLGVERFTRYLTGVENIRDVIPYPRAPKYAEF